MQLTYSYNPRVIGKGDHHLSASGWQRNTSSVEELLQLTAGQGFGFMPALLTASGKSNDHISQFCTVCIDVDNSNGQVTTWTEAMNDPFLQANALCMWQSASSGIVNDKNPEGLDRYRILFKLPSDERICPAGNREGLKPPLPGKLTPLHFVHFPTRGLDGAEQCVATARRSKLM